MQLPNWTDVLDSALSLPLSVANGGTGSNAASSAADNLSVQPREPGVTDVSHLYAPPTVLIKDTYRAAVEAASGGRRTVIYDTNGYPNIMYIIPKFSIEDVFGATTWGSGVFPAFVSNGVEKPYLMVGAYSSGAIGSVPVSLPGLNPYVNINFDNAKARCKAKGGNFHLMTNWEWAAVALWCLKNGYEPRGNTNWGRAYDAVNESGIRASGELPGGTSTSGATRQGTGPASWSHDGSSQGIFDLVGNTWHWIDGFKTVDGIIYMAADNYYSGEESSWTNLGCRVSVAEAKWCESAEAAELANISTAMQQLLVQALIRPALSDGPKPYTPKGYLWLNNSASRFPLRGGDWYGASHAGLAALHLHYERSGARWNVGFRLASGS